MPRERPGAGAGKQGGRHCAGPALPLGAMGSPPGARSRHPLTLEPFELSQLTEILYQPGHFVSKVRLVLQGFARRSSVL